LKVSYFCEVGHFKWIIFTLAGFFISIPFSLVQNLEKFRYANMAWMVAFFLCFGVIIVNLFYGSINISEEDYSNTQPRNMLTSDFRGYLKLFGLIAFLMENIPLVLPVRHVMKKQKEFKNYLIRSFSLVFVLTCILGVAGYYVGSNLLS